MSVFCYFLLLLACHLVASFNQNSKFNGFWPVPKLSRKDSQAIQIIFLLSALTIESSAEIFARLPQQVIYGSSPTVIQKNEISKDKLVLLFPGAGGPDNNLYSLKDTIIKSDNEKNIQRDVKIYDWLQWRGNFIRAAFDSQIVGKTVCKDLSDNQPKLKNIHIIGVSVGSFAADSCAKVLKSQMSKHPIQTRLTFLDPFTSKGIFGFNWGIKNFGKNIDYVENYVNRDDEVPTTNDPLQNALNYDVTKSHLRKDFKISNIKESMHAWPVGYLGRVWKTEVDNKGELIISQDLIQSKGTTQIIQ